VFVETGHAPSLPFVIAGLTRNLLTDDDGFVGGTFWRFSPVGGACGGVNKKNFQSKLVNFQSKSGIGLKRKNWGKKESNLSLSSTKHNHFLENDCPLTCLVGLSGGNEYFFVRNIVLHLAH
jgi:hypothetical protein